MRRRGWWFLGVIVGLLCLLAITFAVWFNSDADLRRAQAFARAAGIATTSEEAGFVAMDARQKAQLERLFVLAKRQRFVGDPEYKEISREVDPPTAELIAYMEAIPPAYWVELDAAIDALPARQFVFFDRCELDNRPVFISDQLALVRLLADRLRVCPVDDVQAIVVRAVRIIHLTQAQSILEQLVDDSCAMYLVKAVTSRRAVLRGQPQCMVVGTEMAVVRDRLWRSRCDSWQGEVASSFDAYAHITRFAKRFEKTRAVGPYDEFQQTVKNWLVPLVLRVNREAYLRHVTITGQVIFQAVDLADLRVRLGRILSPQGPFPWLSRLAEVDPFYFRDPGFSARDTIKHQLAIAVCIADLTQTPLPPDPFSPTLAPLRPVERGGEIIGWYSVGPNGIDDGGVLSKDFGIPLSASFGNPFASAPVAP